MLKQKSGAFRKQLPIKLCQFTKLSRYEEKQFLAPSSQRPLQPEEAKHTDHKGKSNRKKGMMQRSHNSTIDHLNIMKYLDFNSILEEKMNEKKPKKSMYSLHRKSQLRKINITFPNQQDEKIINSSLRYVKSIYEIIKELKEFGFSAKKITQWMIPFLIMKKKLIKDIFITEHINKKQSVNDPYLYDHQFSYEVMKKKLLDIMKKFKKKQKQNNLKDLFLLITELQQFKIYLEDIILQKNVIKLNQLKHSIKKKYQQIKPKTWQNSNGILQPLACQNREVGHFLSELEKVQDQYGNLSLISKLSREKFRKISETQQFIKQKYKDILYI